MGLRQNTTVLYPIYFADDDMFSATVGHLQVTKMYLEENYTILILYLEEVLLAQYV